MVPYYCNRDSEKKKNPTKNPLCEFFVKNLAQKIKLITQLIIFLGGGDDAKKKHLEHALTEDLGRLAVELPPRRVKQPANKQSQLGIKPWPWEPEGSALGVYRLKQGCAVSKHHICFHNKLLTSALS